MIVSPSKAVSLAGSPEYTAIPAMASVISEKCSAERNNASASSLYLAVISTIITIRVPPSLPNVRG